MVKDFGINVVNILQSSLLGSKLIGRMLALTDKCNKPVLIDRKSNLLLLSPEGGEKMW